MDRKRKDYPDIGLEEGDRNVSEPLIPGGCILLARKIIESAIWDKPPLYLKVWVYLLTRAQHGDYKGLKRGQLRTSIPELIEACKWRIGARVERPKKEQIFQVIDWMRSINNSDDTDRTMSEGNAKAPMITTTKATHGLLITISNYADYQDFSMYESNGESNDENRAKTVREQQAAETPRKQREGNAKATPRQHEGNGEGNGGKAEEPINGAENLMELHNESNDENATKPPRKPDGAPTAQDNINKNYKNGNKRRKTIVGTPDDIPYQEIVDYLNGVCGTNYRHSTEETRKLIRARWQAGFTLDDFRQVIMKKHTDWSKNPDMQQYLRPQTLFGTKFESYLNQLSTVGTASTDWDALERELEQ